MEIDSSPPRLQGAALTGELIPISLLTQSIAASTETLGKQETNK